MRDHTESQWAGYQHFVQLGKTLQFTHALQEEHFFLIRFQKKKKTSPALASFWKYLDFKSGTLIDLNKLVFGVLHSPKKKTASPAVDCSV